MKKTIIYDFDGTLYAGDSFIDFFLFLIKCDPLILFIYFFLPFHILLWKTGLYSDKKLKEKFLKPISRFDNEKIEGIVNDFWKLHRSKLFSWVGSELKQDKEKADSLFCISASPSFLLEPVALSLGFNHLIASDFSKDQGKRNIMISKNCKGKEKVHRLDAWSKKNKVNLRILKMVSDSMVDLPLFELAEKCYIVKDKKMELLEV